MAIEPLNGLNRVKQSIVSRLLKLTVAVQAWRALHRGQPLGLFRIVSVARLADYLVQRELLLLFLANHLLVALHSRF